MAFLKKFNRQKSVDLEDEARKKDEKEKAKELKRSKRHSVHVSARRDKPDETANGEEKSKDDSYIDDKALRKRKEELKERERRKFKDMSGMVVTSPNEYPVFIVHYLGRMPADAEYGREAVEDPVHQLCKLREKQKLPKTLLAFNVEGMMCREVSGPFLKPKKEGMTFFIPLHHITYGVASLTHPQVFSIITKMTDDPSPANQVLVLHAFLCDKPEEAQALTYWQLQAYIEAFEDLKRKRMLKMRRKQAMGQTIPETPGASHSKEGTSGGSNIAGIGNSGSGGSGRDGGASSSSKTPTNSSIPVHQNPPSHSPPKTAVVKPKRTNSVTSTTSSSSSSSPSTKKNTPDVSRKSSNASRKSSGDEKADDGIIQLPQKKQPGKLKTGQWPPKRGPPPQLRGPPPDIGPIQVDIPPQSSSKELSRGSGDSRDSAYGEGDEEFPITFSPGPTSPSGTTSPKSPSSGSSIPGIAPRKSSDSGEASADRSSAFESRISELQNLVQMDAEKLKDLMIKEYPTLSRKIFYKMSIDQNGVVTRREEKEEEEKKAKVSQKNHENDDSIA